MHNEGLFLSSAELHSDRTSLLSSHLMGFSKFHHFTVVDSACLLLTVVSRDVADAEGGAAALGQSARAYFRWAIIALPSMTNRSMGFNRVMNISLTFAR